VQQKGKGLGLRVSCWFRFKSGIKLKIRNRVNHTPIEAIFTGIRIR